MLAHKPAEIAKAYITGWFPIDIVSCMPFGYIQYFQSAEEGEVNSSGKSGKLARILRLFRLLKLRESINLRSLTLENFGQSPALFLVADA